jgi:hypothetical protein
MKIYRRNTATHTFEEAKKKPQKTHNFFIHIQTLE